MYKYTYKNQKITPKKYSMLLNELKHFKNTKVLKFSKRLLFLSKLLLNSKKAISKQTGYMLKDLSINCVSVSKGICIKKSIAAAKGNTKQIKKTKSHVFIKILKKK